MRGGVVGVLVAVAIVAGAPTKGVSLTREAHREDRGDLIIVHLYGSYEEMGRQEVVLLGDVARGAYSLQRRDWDRLIAPMGVGVRMMDTILPPLWSWLGPCYEQSGFYAEINGMAAGLGISGADAVRGVYGFLGGGSTVFTASRTATADGNALVGKNSDWGDGYGQRRPVVAYYHPTNGDLAHIMAGTPGPGVPGIGINEAGFALASTFFNSDAIVGVPFPQWPQRRALQIARTVEEGLRIFEQTPTLGISTFMVMADAQGDFALVECTPSECAAYRPELDFLVQTNHARTAEMIPHDRGRRSDSFLRYTAAYEAVRMRLGRLTPESGAQVLRDRSNSRYANDSVVANPAVLNSAIVHPASRTLWHSTTMQPLAPFGQFLAFSFTEDFADARSLPADRRLAAPEMERERAAIAELRAAVRLFDEGKIEESGRLFDALAARAEPSLHPLRLVWAQARVRWTLGKLEQADALLARLNTAETPFDVRAHGLVMRALIADRRGRRGDAVQLYQTAQALLDANAAYTDRNTGAPLRARIAAGLGSPQTKGDMPATPDLQGVPR